MSKGDKVAIRKVTEPEKKDRSLHVVLGGAVPLGLGREAAENGRAQVSFPPSAQVLHLLERFWRL